MNTLDRVILYIGVLLAVIFAAVGVSRVADIKEILRKGPGEGTGPGRGITATYDTGPIYLSKIGTTCSATPGAYYAVPSSTTQLTWFSRDDGYKVDFPPGEDPSKPTSGTDDYYDVPAGGPSTTITIDQAALAACYKSGQCVYYYKLAPAVPGTCSMGSAGTFGIIVKPSS